MKRIFPDVEQTPRERSALTWSMVLKRLVKRALLLSATPYIVLSIYSPIWILFQSETSTLAAMSRISDCPCQMSNGWEKHRHGFEIDPACDPSKSSSWNCLFHVGATACYRQKSSSTATGAQCCYDKHGDWISNWRNGAGTLDFYYPQTWKHLSTYQHFFSDVLSYLSCCFGITQIFSTCDQYMKYRPSGQCISHNVASFNKATYGRLSGRRSTMCF